MQDGHYIYLNEAHARMFGYDTAAALVGKPWQVLYEDAEYQHLQAEVLPILARDREWQGEAIAMRQDGSTFNQTLSLSLTVDNTLICVCRDNTAQKQAALALKAKTDELDRFFSLSADLLFIGDREGRIIRLNREWEKLLGYPLATLEGQHFMEFVHPDDQAATTEASLTLINGKVAPNVINRFRCRDGSYRWLDWRAVLSGEQVFAVARDITDRLAAEAEQTKQAERERLLREISQRIRESLDLQTIFDTACQEIRAVLAADRVGIFTFDAESGYDMGHFVAESVMPPFPSALDAHIHDHCFGNHYAPLYAQGRYAAMDDIYTLEVCHTSVLSQMAVRANLVMPLICGDQLWGLLCVHQCYSTRHWEAKEIEVTQQLANQLAIAIQQANLVEQLQTELSERQQAQAQLSERNHQLAINVEELARATRLKDEFLANMSHELRTPLNAILGMTEALSEATFGPITPQQHKALSTINRSGSHLLSLINDILDMAKIESGQFELELAPTTITSLCESSLSFVNQQAHKKQLKICTNITNVLTQILVDERRLRQALINLLNNAVKFTPTGGSITLNVEISPDRQHLRFSIQDTGIGIAASDIPKLFQPFVQIDSALNRQYAGTGLGLSLVKRIAELHGGSVHLSSEVGIGSCFSLDIPCIELPAASLTAPEPPPTASCSTQTATVLLVEDNETNILTLGSYLEAKGFEVRYANNGQAALDQISANLPDFVIMDIQMPGMDGLTATRHIRETLGFRDLPIIALTALVMQGDRDRCLAAGATDYLSKPVQLKTLVTLMQQLLASPTTAAQSPR